MPCFCQFFNKTKQYRSVGRSAVPSSDQAKTIQEGDVSASELVQLKAEVWSLKNALSDATTMNSNMQDAIRQAVAEKYELLSELQRAKNDIAVLESDRKGERNLFCQDKDKFIKEIASYRTKINELNFLVDTISNQNIELKKSLLEANDTICKIGQKYMKLKSLVYYYEK